jgi:hypothetical protein
MGYTQVFVEALAGTKDVMLEGAGVEELEAVTKVILGNAADELGIA